MYNEFEEAADIEHDSIYDSEYVSDLLDADEISVAEAGFMQGYEA